MFTTVHRNGYMVERTTKGAISPSTGRTLPDRYIEGTCPICGYLEARGDQCDNCGNQLDPTDLIDPRSKINGEVAGVRRDPALLPRPAGARRRAEGVARRARGDRDVAAQRHQVQPEHPRGHPAAGDDPRHRLGHPGAVDGWRGPARPSGSTSGSTRSSATCRRRSSGRAALGEPDRWRDWWNDPEALSYYFMGKDNITFHSQIWPAELLAYDGRGDRGGEPGEYGALNLPTEVVSSEFLTMEGRQFSSSRGVVIYVRDVLERYQPDALRYFISAAGPENQDSNFTWAEFVRRTNDELVAGWGNLVNRTATMVAKSFGEIPAAGDARAATDQALLDARRGGVRDGRRADRPAPPEGGPRRGDADGRRGEQVRLGQRAVEAQGRRRARAARHGPARHRPGGRRLQRAALAVPAAQRQRRRPGARRRRRRGADAGDPRGRGPRRRARRTRSSPATTPASRPGSAGRSRSGTPVGKPGAGVHQARPVRGRRGAGPRLRATRDAAPAGRGRARAWRRARASATPASGRPTCAASGPTRSAAAAAGAPGAGRPGRGRRRRRRAVPALRPRRAPAAAGVPARRRLRVRRRGRPRRRSRRRLANRSGLGGAQRRLPAAARAPRSRPPPTTWTPRCAGCDASRRARPRPAGVVHGDSAGGNLALVAALRNPNALAAARARLPVPRPGAWLRRRTPRRTAGFDPARGGLVLGAVRRDADDLADPDLAPLRSRPARARCRRRWSQAAEHDPLRDEGERAARGSPPRASTVEVHDVPRA